MPTHRKHHITPSISPSTPPPTSSTPVLSFFTQCHYTKLIYLCTHYTFTTKPFVINHVVHCPHHLTNRGRCTNMASVPYEKVVGELCSECRPVSLGLQPHLRSFEVLGGGSSKDKKEKEKGVEGQGVEGEGEEKDWGVEGEQIKKDLKTLEEAFRGLDIKDTIDAGNAAKDKQRKDEGMKDARLWKEKGEWVDIKTRQETLATTPVAENEEPPAIETRVQTPAPAAKANQQPATKTTEQTLAPAPAAENTDTPNKPSFLSSLIKIFSSSTPSSPSPSLGSERDLTTSSSQTQTQTQNQSESSEPWVSISQDPDWENVTQEDKKEVDRKLWKDKGEWIKVNTKQET